MRFVVLLLLVVATPSFACQFNTDCSVGSTCEKPRGQLYGVCKGGMQPGNSYDRTPVYDPLDLNRSHGNTCSFDTDCGPGSRCSKRRWPAQRRVRAPVRDDSGESGVRFNSIP